MEPHPSPAPIESLAQLEEARSSASAAAAAYYDGEVLTMDDAAYDALVAAIAAAEDAHPEWGVSALSTEVAGGASAGGDVAHSTPMLSLDNVFDAAELSEWHERLVRLVGEPAADDLVVEPKLDGLALAVRYEDGVLTQAVTRGDGRSGEDVTGRVLGAAGLPERLVEAVSVEIRGECVMTHESFEAANAERAAAGKAPFANPRNAVAGVVRTLAGGRGHWLSFAAYGVVGGGLDSASHSEAMGRVEGWGVGSARMIAGLEPAQGVAAATEQVEALRARRDALVCDIDGAVVRADAATARSAGSTSRAPRWAIAYKYPPDSRLTELVGIEVAVGRTGALSFTAVLSPVAVGGVVIERATLHNATEIARKDVRVGDQVWVRRAGEVIPEVVGPNLELRGEGLEAFEAPPVCPRCASALDQSSLIWRCVRGRACGLAESIRYAVSRDCLDVEGLGEVHVTALVEGGFVTDVADLYELDEAVLEGLPRMGATSAAAVKANLERAKGLPLSRQLAALGLRLTGRRISSRLAGAFSSMAALRAAGEEDLAAVEGMGPVRAASVAAELVELSEVLDRLEALGVCLVEEVVQVGGVWEGKKVCVTGSIEGMGRRDANEAVEALGGRPVSSVSAATDILVAGAGGGSKRAKAESLGVEVVSAEDFLALVAAARG